MKKSHAIFVLLLSVLPFCTLNSHAQTLQFSQVKLVSSSTETVPTGKVWKICSMLPSTRLTTAEATGGTSSASTTSSATQQIVTINGLSVYLASSDAKSRYSTYSTGGIAANASATSANSTISPIWLPAGTTVAAGSGLHYVSVIEFTVVP